MAKARKAFPLRLDAELHQALERWAADEFRSVNGHIEYLLREAVRKAGRLPSSRVHPPSEPGESVESADRGES
ncbi:toxin-antitoxin system HicB family antitoxin [Cohnella sp. AR92]|uniref:toxin-antitoxin system HicB family antitoxin n=1 Tax=Cohnella sp. AR92 TaxID=648716 RepID=UPI000F8F230D|nr:toxin-antitoxin system HicB family antitoxin [Cohnella sp. AR92]RUS45202.1 toxin-antitoxin system HicB family antitoxin [Cohnella sp. AR92]